MSSAFVVRSQVLGEYQGFDASMASRRANREIDKKLERKKKKWRILPAENMTVKTLEGLILSVPHEIGRYMLMHRTAAIIEHEVEVDAVIEGNIEQFIEGNTAW